MNPLLTPRLQWLLWIAVFVLLIADWYYPPSTEKTRLAGLILFLVFWCGLIALLWRNRLARIGILTFTVFFVLFILIPIRREQDQQILRSHYVTALLRYEGVPYYWGGESPKGIDCSGLIRRGFIDSMFWQGIRTFDAGLVRFSIGLWWHDCTARDLANDTALIAPLCSVPSLNKLDERTILPGDLAVTSDGSHIMAYLGKGEWIEADPLIGKVITVSTPSKENVFFYEPMNIIRWKYFSRTTD